MEIRRLIGRAAAISILFIVYRWLHEYDWGQPFTKFICFAVIFALLFQAGRASWLTGSTAAAAQLGAHRPSRAVLLEWAVLLFVIGWTVFHYAPLYLKQMTLVPKVDIGYTTEHAASMLFRAHRNPYSSDQINIRPELLPRFRGFHYGPFMLVGYAAGLVSAGLGYKISSLVFFLGTLGVLGASSISRSPARGLSAIGTFLCFLLLAILPERLWYELFQQGANDIFPVFLLASAVLLLQLEKWGSAGLLVGLSFSAKFSPAIFFLVALARRRPTIRIFTGFAVGCIPLLVFLMWDFRGAVNNIFVVRFLLRYDSTSLYSITPPALHFIFTLCQLVAVAVVVWKDWNEPLAVERIVSSFMLVLIVEEVCFKEIHANHFIWFFPFIAYLVAGWRYPSTAPLSADAPASNR